MGLPKVLEDMLQVALANSTLQTWNIFQDKDGAINFKLKFGAAQESVSHIQPASYKRKTPRQVQRDLDRSKQWQDKKKQPPMQNDTTGESTVLSCPTQDQPLQSATGVNSSSGVKTRSKSRAEPELFRTEDEQNETSLNPLADSFILPCTSPESSVTDLSQDLSSSIDVPSNSVATLCDAPNTFDINLYATTLNGKDDGCLGLRRRKRASADSLSEEDNT